MADTQHPRWARATANHVSQAKKILLERIQTTGRPLTGGVTASLLSGLSMYDLLDFAQTVEKESSIGLGRILDEARTLPTPDPPQP